MVRSNKWLLTTACLAVTGWVIAAGLTMALINSGERLANAQKNAEAWKRKAGKAYTSLLRDTETDNSSVLIPEGGRVECTPNAETSSVSNKSLLNCDGIIYPPENY
ncbi:hypothetical protein [Enterobacter hormaechei]|uniref:hypothetical protein n=1 Tax=Enterobacter hormaechei TaxID=158836 RepID=UPI001A07395D|nr:hypothetical protein [Enterobacter hormaechei]EGO4234256.1 hypothetical protein [Escherichia coli]MED5714492.1 hypothetical protein [Enterobacter hormaechei]